VTAAAVVVVTAESSVETTKTLKEKGRKEGRKEGTMVERAERHEYLFMVWFFSGDVLGFCALDL
jgi:hypothetical protein